MVGGIDTDREPVDGLARARQPVELRHQLRHALPELACLRLGDTGVPDEAPELPVAVRGRRFPRGDLEVVEVPGHPVALRAALDADVEHACRAPVEALLDR